MFSVFSFPFQHSLYVQFALLPTIHSLPHSLCGSATASSSSPYTRCFTSFKNESKSSPDAIDRSTVASTASAPSYVLEHNKAHMRRVKAQIRGGLMKKKRTQNHCRHHRRPSLSHPTLAKAASCHSRPEELLRQLLLGWEVQPLFPSLH